MTASSEGWMAVRAGGLQYPAVEIRNAVASNGLLTAIAGAVRKNVQTPGEWD
jgi:hypothetical protein